MGKTIFVTMIINQTAIGTASGAVLATLPVIANSAINYMFAGRENAVNGKMLQGIAGAGANVEIFNYDNTAPIGNGFQLLLSGVYEAA